MSIKSEKAKEYIMDRATDVDLDPETGWTEKMIERKHALAALKIGIADAEQICRERAVRALCGFQCGAGDSCTPIFAERERDCEYIQEYLKYYDNEK